FSSNILVTLDISDPAQPKEAGRWWMTGQKAGETKPEGPEGFHGPANISPDGKMASMAYSPAVVNLDISDAANPKLIGKLTFSSTFVAVGARSLHRVLPGRGAIAAHGSPVMGAQFAVRELRGHRGTLQ